MDGITGEIIFEKADDILKIHIYENLVTDNFTGSSFQQGRCRAQPPPGNFGFISEGEE